MPAEDVAPPVLVAVARNGFVESVHRGHVAVATTSGEIVASIGDPTVETYPRSALKPFQAVATLGLLAEGGITLGVDSIAIATASHDASETQQIEAAYLLALAGLDEDALLCPPAFATEEAPRAAQHGVGSRLAHNCSGKHAAFLLAQVTSGQDPAAYLDPAGGLQRRVTREIAQLCGADPVGPGVDGCGAPAWRIPLAALATGFARLAAGVDGLATVRDAMRARPELVGGAASVDTQLMLADARVVAKRGAEAVLGAAVDGASPTREPLGVAVKICDGGARAVGPVVGAALTALGATVAGDVLRPQVLGGGAAQGELRVTRATAAALEQQLSRG